MRKTAIVAALALGGVILVPSFAQASSHREAPFVTKNPKTDGTDFYIFDSYDPAQIGTGGVGQFVTIIADYQPFQDPWGGPNYFTMDPDALYEIMIDNTGDGVEDITFQFQFSNALGGTGGAGVSLPIGPDAGAIAVPLTVIGPFAVGGTTNATQNVLETYTLNMVTGARRTGKVAAVNKHGTTSNVFNKPMDNVGSKVFACGGATLPITGSATECGNYATYAKTFVSSIDIPGCTTQGNLFVGQRAEPFAVNIGPVFDLINEPLAAVAGGSTVALRSLIPNPLQFKNVTTLALELPLNCTAIVPAAAKGIIGGWTTASVPQARLINPTGTYALPAKEGGAWAQVSRLGMPLVNEVVIGLPDKDFFNSSEPSGDLKNFAKYIEFPTMPQLISAIFGATNAPAPTGVRADLVTIFATGVTGVNANGATCEYTRLNTGINPTVAGSQVSLGAAACFPNQDFTPVLTAANCDPAGFPNGRRPGDDITDIELRSLMGYFLATAVAPASQVPFTDAVIQQASQFDTTFPYLKAPSDYLATAAVGP